MDMVEKVARAAHDAQWDEPFPVEGSIAYAVAMQVARAAIEAMREPDHDMTANVLKPGEDRTFLVELWQRMIDGALDEPTPIAALSPSGEK